MKDTRAEYQLLHAALHGNLLLAGLTYGERALQAGTKLLPVPRSAAEELATLSLGRQALATALPGAQGGASHRGCLVTRWENVWVVWTEDKRRSFVNLRSLSAPAAAACKRRATAVNDELSQWEKRGGGDGPSYALGAESRCVRARLRRWEDSFAGTLVLMHNGSARAAVLRAAADGARTAAWRHGRGERGNVEADVVAALAPPAEGGPHLSQAFDSPGSVLTATADGVSLEVVRSEAPGAAARRWRVHRLDGGGVALEAAAGSAGRFLSLRRRPGRRGGAAPRAPRSFAPAEAELFLAGSDEGAPRVFSLDAPPPSTRRRATGRTSAARARSCCSR